MEKALLTVAEAALYLGCGRSMVFELIRAGEFGVVKLGRATRIPKVELDRWIGARTAPLVVGAEGPVALGQK